MAKDLRCDQDISILLIRARELEPHLLVPAMHSTDRIRLGGKSQILMNSGVLPPDAFRIGISTLEGADSMNLAYAPDSGSFLFDLYQRRAPAVRPVLFGDRQRPM